MVKTIQIQPKGTEKEEPIKASGMYDILKIVIVNLAQEEKNCLSTKELKEIIALSEQSINQNLSRLVKANLLIKNDLRDSKGRRTVQYKLNKGVDIIDKILNHLF